MNYSEYLVQDTPKISVSKKKININSKNGNTCSLRVENIAGGFLFGDIVVYDDFIKVNEYVFNKNSFDVVISIDFEQINIYNSMTRMISIFSNGGDIKIELEIIKDQISFEINEFTNICTLKDLFSLARKDLKEVAKFFNTNEFAEFLKSLDAWAYEIYKFTKDSKNIYKRIDDFFILMGLKFTTETLIDKELIESDIKYGDTNNLIEKLVLKKSDFGFCESTVKYDKDSFIKIDADVITNDMFGSNDEFVLDIEILNNKISNKKNHTEVYINNKKIDVVINKKFEPIVVLDKYIYKDEEQGVIYIENSIDTNLEYDIICDSKNIEFDRNNGVINDVAKIEFKVHFTKFNRGVIKFFGQPYFDANIIIKFRHDEYKFRKEIRLTLATESLELR